MLDLAFNNFTTGHRFQRDFFEKIIKLALSQAPVKKIAKTARIGVSVNLVGESRIKALNRRYRGKNRVTDVLAFPLFSPKPQGQPNQSAIMELGDIFICPAQAAKLAKKESIRLDLKMVFLTVHGLLHLLGYDHEKSPSREKKMNQLQEKIFKKLKGI